MPRIENGGSLGDRGARKAPKRPDRDFALSATLGPVEAALSTVFPGPQRPRMDIRFEPTPGLFPEGQFIPRGVTDPERNFRATVPSMFLSPARNPEAIPEIAFHESLHAYAMRPEMERRLSKFASTALNTPGLPRFIRSLLKNLPSEAYAALPGRMFALGQPIPIRLQQFYPFPPNVIYPQYAYKEITMPAARRNIGWRF